MQRTNAQVVATKVGAVIPVDRFSKQVSSDSAVNAHTTTSRVSYWRLTMVRGLFCRFGFHSLYFQFPDLLTEGEVPSTSPQLQLRLSRVIGRFDIGHCIKENGHIQ